MNKRRLAAVLLIMMGLVLLAAPQLTERWDDYRQQMLLAKWEQSLTLLDEPLAQTEAELTAALAENAPSPAEETDEQKAQAAYLAEHLAGTLDIPSIELHQPVLDETNQDNLRIALTIVQPSAAPGEAGTFTTAAEHFTYTVTAIDIVEPNDTTVLVSKKHQAEITLITCYPQKNPDKRLIVKGVLLK